MKIIVLSSHTISLLRFRIDMMKDFIRNGHEVIAVGPDSENIWKERFKEYNIKYKQIYVKRNGINPISDIRTLISLYKLIKEERPDRIFSYQAKTIIYGSIASKLNKITEYYPMIAGLGSVFRGIGFKIKIIKNIMKIQYKIACKYSKKVFFQNIDDKNEFITNKLVDVNKIYIINGSGVNLDVFKPAPFPKTVTFLFIGRLIKDKGVLEYLEACKVIKLKYPTTRCLLVGPYDTNPSALKPKEIKPYLDDNIVEYYGEQSDVREFISQSSVFVLPSYHEGTPKTILEAMAMGRPIITCDAPGCRETVQNGVNGYLVNIKDVNGLISKMEYYIFNKNIISKMGAESLNIVREKYDVNIINNNIMKVMGII